VAAQNCRERLIDETLSLCTRFGYESTTVDQIAAAADMTLPEFAGYFASKDAVVMSIVEDLLQAQATALGHVEESTSPEQVLMIATTEVVTAIIDGRGVITRDRMLAMVQIVTANPKLLKQASCARKRVLTQALAERMGVAAENRRVRKAVTMWSAIAASAYLARDSMADHYDPGQDDQLTERMTAELDATFADVMGETPHTLSWELGPWPGRTDASANSRGARDRTAETECAREGQAQLPTSHR
jgi:AcrR family transcriptional regulator